MNIPLFGLTIFVVSVTVIELMLYLVKISRNTNRKKINRRLMAMSSKLKYDLTQEPRNIEKKRILSEVPLLNRLLTQISGVRKLEALLLKSNAKCPLGFYVLFSVVLAIGGYALCFHYNRNILLSFMVSIISAVLPFYYLKRKKNKRMMKFQRQLPEGMELMARALKAGHAFTSGMRIAADEFDDPLGTELAYALDEINFGVSLADALTRLTKRVDCTDLKYFVVSVILQRETGGNLAEIISTSANIIRERFKLQGKIRVLSAEGRITATVLIVIPFFIAAAIFALNPDYLKTLLTEPAGRMAMLIAGIMMAIGIFSIKKMIQIKV